MSARCSLSLAVGIASLLPLGLHATDSPEGLELFEKKIRPALIAHCVECHGAEKQKGGLRVDSREPLRTGGDSGPAVVPGKPADSLLLSSIKHLDPDMKMPAKAPKLEDSLIEDFERWITLGAPDPRDHPPTAAEAAAGIWTQKFNDWKQWWCFQPVRPSAPPTVKDAAWSAHPVDRFLLAGMETRGLAPAADADPRTLFRRLSYQLTGLPPTPAETERFAAQPDVAKAVEGFLASPHFGEHWARHWMDLVRFAETHGSEGDPEIPEAWRYRDYLIKAFNSDVPADQLIREHLAGDLLPNPRIDAAEHTNESAIGTAHLRLVEHGFQPVDTRDEQVKTLDSQIDTAMKAFQALTVSCARCHDHKFDPISQHDYYALQGIFANGRPAMVTIDQPEALTKNDAALTALKAKLKPLIAGAWLAEAARFPDRLRAYDAAQARQQQLTERISQVEQQLAAVETEGRQKLSGAAKPALPVIPMARWTFDADAHDTIGHLDGELLGGAQVRNGRLVLDGKEAQMRTAPLAHDLREKTLEAWVAPANLTQRGGGVISVEDQNGAIFDSVVFAEKQPRRWIAGSDNFRRSIAIPAPEETAEPGQLIHLACVWQADRRIAFFRNGQPYGEPFTPNAEQMAVFAAGNARVLLGLRHTRSRGFFAGEIEEARLYDRALGVSEIAASYAAGPGGDIAKPEAIFAALSPEAQARHRTLSEQIANLRREITEPGNGLTLAWMKAIAAAKSNATHPLAPWLAVREGGAERWTQLKADRAKTLTADTDLLRDKYRLIWDLADPQVAAKWFRHGCGLPDQPFHTGDFAVLPGSEAFLTTLMPAGFHTHSLSTKHNGILQSPRFKIDSDFISVRAAGAGGAQVRVIVDGYPLPNNGGIFARAQLDKAEPAWVKLDTKYRRGSWAYLEFATRADLTKSDKKAADGPISWFEASLVAFHDEDRTPGEVIALDTLDSATPEALAAQTQQAIQAWQSGHLTEPDRILLQALLRTGLLPTTTPEGNALVTEYRRLEAEIPEPHRIPGVLETDQDDAPLLTRGDHLKPAELVPRSFLSVVDATPFSKAPASRSGRLELARAITDPRNPLTARVMVNRAWHWIFGRGLVGTPDNFGRMGQKPTNPELLDYLAARFAAPEAEGGFAWSFKKLITHLATTRTFALASTPPPTAAELDTPNDLLTHSRIRRLEAEPLRDSLLVLAGQLDDRMYGPGDNALAQPKEQTRRSLYLTIRRNTLSPFLAVFDAPKPFATTGRRDETNVPAQSLTLLNSPFVIHCAERFADRATKAEPSDAAARAGWMFAEAFGRPATTEELATTHRFLDALAADESLTPDRLLSDRPLWRDFAQSLINAKEFIYLR